MSSVTMDLIAENALESIRHAERMAPHGKKLGALAFVLLMFSTIAAWYIRVCSTKIADHINKLRVCVIEIQQLPADDSTLIDPEMHLRDRFEAIKDCVRALREPTAELAKLARREATATKFGIEVRRFAGINEELYKVVSQLQWEIAEHDASYCGRIEGFVATNKEELDAMMDRIMGG